MWDVVLLSNGTFYLFLFPHQKPTCFLEITLPRKYYITYLLNYFHIEYLKQDFLIFSLLLCVIIALQ